MITREELARKVLNMLSVQQRYFKRGDTFALEAFKLLERELKHECERILEPPVLFREGDFSEDD